MRYRFGDYVFDTQRHELHRAGELIKLRRKVFQVLAYLLAHRHRVVPKQELLAQLWPNQFVGEETLTSCIKTLRRALGERGRTARFVRTLHGQGYRFMGAVELWERRPTEEPPHELPWRKGEGATRRDEELSPVQPSLPVELMSPGEMQYGEYKQVTVLSCALAEASTLVARLGAEAMYHLLHDVWELARETVQRYEGTLTEIPGEGFLAMFGAPVTQEDHARRAVLAAFEFRQRLRGPKAVRGQPHGVAVRLGLHSGPVVVGPLASEPARTYTAAGDVLPVVTQLQQRAMPDTLLVSAATYALVQDEVQAEVYGTLPFNASSTTLPVYAIRGLLQRRAGLPRRGDRPLSRFVGRAPELALLHERLEHALGGQGQVIGIAGEAGLGKSRLLAEFMHSLKGRPVTCCEGHCLAYGRATPYLPVRDLVRQLWDIPDAAPATVIIDIVQQRLCEAGVKSDNGAFFLLQLLDVAADLEPLATLSPPMCKAQTFALLWQVIHHASQRQPLMLAVENLHWIDPSSEEWLASLVERLGDVPVLLLTTYRPGYQPPWIRHSAATQIALPRLSLRDSLIMLQSVPQAAELPVSVQEAIVSRAAGNPFFMEELTWAAVQQGDHSGTLPLPDTVEAALMARIDLLPAEQKHLVQTAAVIGSEVPVPLLQRLVGLSEDVLQRGLAQLQAKEFLYETHMVPDQVYTFKHALTREVAYGSMLHERRCALHRQIVEILEALSHECPGESAERLAHHALRGELWEKAVAYCQQAGEKAWSRGAFREAATYYERALDALDHLPEHPDIEILSIELRRCFGGVLSLVGEQRQSLAVLGEAAARARQLGDRVRLAGVLCRMATVLTIVGDFGGAIAAGEEAMELAIFLGDRALHVNAAYRLGQAYEIIGDYKRAAELLRGNVQAMTRSVPDNMRVWCVTSQARLAYVLSLLGEFAEGRRHGEEAVRLSMTDEQWQGNARIVTRARLGFLYLVQGDLEAAIRMFEDGLALCHASDQKASVGPIAGGLGEAYTYMGRLADGLALLEEACQNDLHMGALGHHYITHLRQLSAVYLLLERLDEARQHAWQALDLARQRKARGQEALALFQLGAVQAQARRTDVQPAEACYQEALMLAEALGMRPLQAHCHHGLGTFYAKCGRPEQARAVLTTAIELYRAMAMAFWLPRAEGALAEVEGR